MNPDLGAHLPVWSILLPLAAAVLAFLLPGRWRGGLSIVVSWLLLGIAGWACVYVTRFGPLRYPLGGWGAPLGIELRLDGVSAVLLMLAAVVGGAILTYATSYLRLKQGPHAPDLFFWPLMLFLLGGLNALFLSTDVFNVYVSLEILTLSAVGLIALAGTRGALVAGARYLLLGLLGSMLYLLGVGILYATTARLEFGALGAAVQPGAASSSALALMTLGLLIKAALFPLHIWLPPAHARAPAPVSAVLSGLVVMAPFYLLARLWFEVFPAVAGPAACALLGVLGSAAILWGGVQALCQERLKMVIAYSTVSQLGYLFLMFPLASAPGVVTAYAWNGGVYFAVAHACAKAAAFLAAGALLLGLGHDRVKDLNGTAERYPLLAAALAVAGINLMGLPPSGGFVAKWMMIKAALGGGQWGYAVIMAAGGLLAAAYMFRVVERLLPARTEGEPLPPLPMRLQAPALGLALVATLLGLAAALPLGLLEYGAPAPAGPLELITGGPAP